MKNLWCLLVALLFVSNSCFARDTFKLNEKIQERGSYCFVRQAAVDVANGRRIKSAEAIPRAHLDAGACAAMRATIIYSRKVYQYENIRVYEGKIGDITIFNPTLDIAEDEEDL